MTIIGHSWPPDTISIHYILLQIILSIGNHLIVVVSIAKKKNVADNRSRRFTESIYMDRWGGHNFAQLSRLHDLKQLHREMCLWAQYCSAANDGETATL